MTKPKICKNCRKVMKGAIMLKDKGPYCMMCASKLSKHRHNNENDIKLQNLSKNTTPWKGHPTYIRDIEGEMIEAKKKIVGCDASGEMQKDENAKHPTETV